MDITSYRNELLAVKSVPDIYALYERWHEELGDDFYAVKETLNNEKQVTDYLFTIRLAHDLTQVAGYFAEEKAADKPVEISWAEAGIVRLKRENPNDFDRVLGHLSKTNQNAWLLLQDLMEVVKKKEKAKQAESDEYVLQF